MSNQSRKSAVTVHRNPDAPEEMRNTNKSEQAVTVKMAKSFVQKALVALCVLGASASLAQALDRGPVTNLPLPRFVSMKASEGNVRRGPSQTHRIDWVFKRRGVPLEITAEYGHWRRVRDRDGAGGWMHYALLSGARTVLIEHDMTQVFARPDTRAQVTAAFELGVIARLGECSQDWCEVSAGGYKGWAHKEKLWGVAPDELRE